MPPPPLGTPPASQHLGHDGHKKGVSKSRSTAPRVISCQRDVTLTH